MTRSRSPSSTRRPRIFEYYLPHCREIELERWRRRSFGHRLVDNTYYLFNELM
jgi:hypothetical protein